MTETKYRYTGQLAQDVLGLDYYVARWFDPSLHHFIQADNLIAGLLYPQAWDRYSYVINNPLLYTDPSGYTWECLGQNNDHCSDNGDGHTSGMVADPSKLPRRAFSSGFLNVLDNITNLGLYGNSQASIEYNLATELTIGIVNDQIMTPASQGNLFFQGISNRYKTFCSSGTFSVDCINNFWGYNEGPIKGSPMPTSYDTHQMALIGDMASSILNPGNIYNKSGINIQSNPSGDCRSGGGSGSICHYATNNSNMNAWITANANEYNPNQNPKNRNGVSWSFVNGNSVLYGWRNGINSNGTEQIGYVMSQAMYNYFLMVNGSVLY
ncbi:MAG: RHS repeat-associated core domain-containing protein [Anaerolineaceae bacterium]